MIKYASIMVLCEKKIEAIEGIGHTENWDGNQMLKARNNQNEINETGKSENRGK